MAALGGLAHHLFWQVGRMSRTGEGGGRIRHGRHIDMGTGPETDSQERVIEVQHGCQIIST